MYKMNFTSKWSFAIFIHLQFFCHSLAYPYQNPQASHPSSNNASDVATFEDFVGSRLQQLRSTWRDIAPWAVYVSSSNGRPTYRIEPFQEVTIAAYDSQYNLLITTETQKSNPSRWNLPSIQPVTATMTISTWNWDQPRIGLAGAWVILRRTTQALIIQIILIQYLNGPDWGPHDQQYYVFYPDLSPDHVFCVGARDGHFYRPPEPIPPPMN